MPEVMTDQLVLHLGEGRIGSATRTIGQGYCSVEVDCPATAEEGETVTATVTVTNLDTTDWVFETEIWAGSTLIGSGGDLISAGTSKTYYAYFTMPAYDVTVLGWVERVISFFPFETEFAGAGSATVVYVPAPEVTDWVALAQVTISINIPEVVAWVTMAAEEISIGITEVVGWVTMAAEEISIGITEVVGWVTMAAEAISIEVSEVEGPPEVELLEERIYPYAYVYEGKPEGTTFTFRSDPFTPESWIVGRLAAALEAEVRKAGGRMLEMRVYVDRRPLFWSDWSIEVIGVPPEATPGVAMPVGIAWWGIAILAALAIILIIIITWAIGEVYELIFKRKPGLHEVKPGWSKETLIGTIQDSEEYWERTLTPIETLEGMSEEDLRVLLDAIAEEEVGEEMSPWAVVAIVGGLGVLGVGAALALSAGQRTEWP